MVKRKFKNISGKKINVFTKIMNPGEISELEVPNLKRSAMVKQSTFTGGKYWELSKWQEIENLIATGYIEEIKT